MSSPARIRNSRKMSTNTVMRELKKVTEDRNNFRKLFFAFAAELHYVYPKSDLFNKDIFTKAEMDILNIESRNRRKAEGIEEKQFDALVG